MGRPCVPQRQEPMVWVSPGPWEQKEHRQGLLRRRHEDETERCVQVPPGVLAGVPKGPSQSSRTQKKMGNSRTSGLITMTSCSDKWIEGSETQEGVGAVGVCVAPWPTRGAES